MINLSENVFVVESLMATSGNCGVSISLFASVSMKILLCFWEISFARIKKSCTLLTGEVCAKARHNFIPIDLVIIFKYKREITTVFIDFLLITGFKTLLYF